MASSSVLIKTDGRGVGSVILNRPRVNNAYNSDMIQGLTEAINELSSNLILCMSPISIKGL